MDIYYLNDIINNYKDYDTELFKFLRLNDHIYDLIKDNLKICVTHIRLKIVEHNLLIEKIQTSDLTDQIEVFSLTRLHNKSPWVFGILGMIVGDWTHKTIKTFKMLSFLHVLYSYCKTPKKVYPFDNEIKIQLRLNTYNTHKELKTARILIKNQVDMCDTFLNLLDYKGWCNLRNRHDLRCWLMSILINDILTKL